MRVFWTGEAIDDRLAILDFVSRDKPLAALSLDELFEEKAQFLQSNSGIGRPGRVVGTREWVVHKSFVLIYDSLGEDMRILRVLHTARQWPTQD